MPNSNTTLGGNSQGGFSVTGTVANHLNISLAEEIRNNIIRRMELDRETVEAIMTAEGGTEAQVQGTRDIPTEEMKKRHLNSGERAIFHRPKKDWIVTENGKEICRSSSVLDVSDLVAQLV